jgi:uncharacterized membrane protein SpoIIM required for sporulation
MKKATFEEKNADRWTELEELLVRLEKRKAGTEAGRAPALFRQACHDLSLAQHRMYGRKLCERLNSLVVRGYQQIHRSRNLSWPGVFKFVAVTFPRAVRADWRIFVLALTLFWLPFGAMIAAAYFQPHWVFSMLSPAEMSMMDSMHGAGSAPTKHFAKEYGDFGVHFTMFGYYVQHNIGIGLKMFGMGILFTIGSIYELVWEGLKLGAMFGYLHYTGHAQNIWRFAIGHSSFEITGLIVCGTAGIRLGLGVLFPGRLPRSQAIAAAGRRALPILLGGAGMVFLAAIVEGFWSSQGWLSDPVRYTFGLGFWVFWLLYFLLAGRGFNFGEKGVPHGS